jgi:hypothetical protein
MLMVLTPQSKCIEWQIELKSKTQLFVAYKKCTSQDDKHRLRVKECKKDFPSI